MLEILKRELQRVDPLFDRCGIRSGRVINLLTAVNVAAHLGDVSHQGGDSLDLYLHPPVDDCRFPAGSHHIGDVKAALKQYGTVAL